MAECRCLNLAQPTTRLHSLTRRRTVLPHTHRLSRRGGTCQAKGQDTDEDLLRADLDRLQGRGQAGPGGQEEPKLVFSRRGGQRAGEEATGLQGITNKVLIADFFFILAALGWFVAGLAEKSAVQTTRLLDTWILLWPLVFQPALGVLMLGALVSAASDRLQSK